MGHKFLADYCRDYRSASKAEPVVATKIATVVVGIVRSSAYSRPTESPANEVRPLNRSSHPNNHLSHPTIHLPRPDTGSGKSCRRGKRLLVAEFDGAATLLLDDLDYQLAAWQAVGSDFRPAWLKSLRQIGEVILHLSSVVLSEPVPEGYGSLCDSYHELAVVCAALGSALRQFVNEVQSGNAEAPMVEIWKAFHDAVAFRAGRESYIPLLLAS
jgi:hypothetical protein